MKYSNAAIKLLENRYCSHGEKPVDVYPRVAKEIAKHTPGKNGNNFEKDYSEMMINLDFLPNSPCIRNAGRGNMNKACLAGDTVIHCAHGDYTIKDLAEKDSAVKVLYVFSRDEDGDIRCSKATWPIMTRQNAVMLKIIFDTGHSIKVTEDHLIMMRDGAFKEARCLQEGMSIMPFTFYRIENGHRLILRDDGKFYPGHRIVYRDIVGELKSGYDTHHDDFNKINDYPDNLKQLTHSKHAAIHFKGNTWNRGKTKSAETKLRMSIAQRKYHKEHPMSNEEKLQLSIKTKERFSNPEERKKTSIATKKAMQRPEVRENYLKGMEKYHNHRIIAIERLVTREDVYDIEIVDKYHNFAANGIFVHNCFVLPVEDSISGIYKALKESAQIFKMGGGVGYNFSDLREKGAPLSHGGTSSGALSFMNMFNASTEAVKQGGFRRGASMGVLDFDHPEIIQFIQEKSKHNRLNNFNVSVLVNNDFMKRVANDDDIKLKSRWDKRRVTHTIKARDIFNLITLYAWDNGDPGLLFFDRINKDNSFYPGEQIRSTNPCGEVPLFPYESCCLGSINLSHCVTSDSGLDTAKLEYLIEKGTYFLMGMNKSSKFPIPECYEAQERYFRLGLGVMGYADMLMKMHIKYDSVEALKVIDKIGRRLQKAEKYAPISTATLSIAPTGSLSILANCSSGIEPIFAPAYERHVTDGIFKETRDNEYLRTAHQISPDWHLKTLARWQKWIDNGVSKTINLPYEASQSDVAELYTNAWKTGCKGITIYRDGCRGEGGQVYQKVKCDGDSCYL